MKDSLQIAARVIQIAKGNEELVRELTPLKLQKLLYYIQGWYAANRNSRLIQEDFEAWPLGPVVPEVYEHFKNHGAASLSSIADSQLRLPSLDDDAALDEEIKKVLVVYGNMSPYELVKRTHEQSVWKNNVKSYNRIMPFDDIRNTFLAKKVFGSES